MANENSEGDHSNDRSSGRGPYQDAAVQCLQLQEKYGKDCKLIENVGEFAYIAEVKNKQRDFSLKFQIAATYPQTPASVFVKSGKMTEQSRGELCTHLEEMPCDTSLESLVDLAYKWVADRNLDLSFSPQECSTDAKKNRNPHKMSHKRKVKRRVPEEVICEKANSMKTATDVIKRILWDEDIQNDCIFVGYLDRFLGVVEKPFTTFSWEDISSVDYDTLAIPKHRIQYFKYKTVKIWDKFERFDNVFGSVGTGLTIQHVIHSYEETEQANREDHLNQRKEENQTIEHHSESDDDEDDDDDDIIIDTGSHTLKEFTDEEHVNSLPAPQAYWGAKVRPTHFLALRITNPAIIEAVRNVQEMILDMEPNYAECVIPPERLHITICCLGLDNEEQIQQAVETLQAIKSDLISHNPASIALHLNDVDHFFHNTLHVPVQENHLFMDLVDHLRMCFTETGIDIRNIFEFKPHMTLLKLSLLFKKEMHTRLLDSRLFKVLSGYEFGMQIVDNIHLCSMSRSSQGDDGFYECPSHITFTN